MRWLLALLCVCFASLATAQLTVTVIKQPVIKQPVIKQPVDTLRAGQAPGVSPTPAVPQPLPQRQAVPGALSPAVLPSPPASMDTQLIDKVLVLKSVHKLELISHGQPVKTYRISLGKHPLGPKFLEGDRRTPEGFYWLDWRKTSNNFNLAMHISYPNLDDSARARREGVDPGGMIMIHGTPISDDYPEWYFASLDWTDGCIAMNNSDMREVWSRVKDGTMIEIRP
jgi:lipoprotein-anchoring transpeptidase ErfK/SrfK